MRIKFKLFGKLQPDKETIELTKQVSNFFIIARFEINGISYDLAVEKDKENVYVGKSPKNG